MAYKIYTQIKGYTSNMYIDYLQLECDLLTFDGSHLRLDSLHSTYIVAIGLECSARFRGLARFLDASTLCLL